jgi:hypothetical protein
VTNLGVVFKHHTHIQKNHDIDRRCNLDLAKIWTVTAPRSYSYKVYNKLRIENSQNGTCSAMLTCPTKLGANLYKVHADASNFIEGVTKDDAYEQVLMQAEGLFTDQRNWVSFLSQK